MTNAAINPVERRQHHRYDVDCRVTARTSDAAFEARTVDMSEGGLCLEHTGGTPLEHGQEIVLELHVPEQEMPERITGRVRWSGRRSEAGSKFGIEFFGGMRGRAVKVLAALAVGFVPLAANAADSVPSFDPNADIVLDAEGGERPDELQVQTAFEETFGEIDVCVEKARKGKTLPGDAHLAVLLSPKGEKPLGVNADLAKDLKKNKKLNDCIRVAASHAHYPSYDGPPVVVTFDFELDPGFVEE